MDARAGLCGLPTVGRNPAHAESSFLRTRLTAARHQGLPGPGAVGDALITVTIARHPLFERDGANLRATLPIALYEAVLGAKVRVPTLDGAVDLAIPANTSSGRTFRLKGKGLPDKRGTGDLYVTVRIALPDKSDPELEALMRKWRDETPYDARKDLG